jgi:hypothetical protein
MFNYSAHVREGGGIPAGRCSTSLLQKEKLYFPTVARPQWKATNFYPELQRYGSDEETVTAKGRK